MQSYGFSSVLFWCVWLVWKSNSHSLVFDLVWLLNSVELNPEIEFDWVRLSLTSKYLIDYARLLFNYKFIDSEGMVTRRKYTAAGKVACLWDLTQLLTGKYQMVLWKVIPAYFLPNFCFSQYFFGSWFCLGRLREITALYRYVFVADIMFERYLFSLTHESHKKRLNDRSEQEVSICESSDLQSAFSIKNTRK